MTKWKTNKRTKKHFRTRSGLQLEGKDLKAAMATGKLNRVAPTSAVQPKEKQQKQPQAQQKPSTAKRVGGAIRGALKGRGGGGGGGGVQLSSFDPLVGELREMSNSDNPEVRAQARQLLRQFDVYVPRPEDAIDTDVESDDELRQQIATIKMATAGLRKQLEMETTGRPENE